MLVLLIDVVCFLSIRLQPQSTRLNTLLPSRVLFGALEFHAEASRRGRLRRLASLRADADAARARAEGIMNDVYPKAVKTLAQVREGYARGGFLFADVQDAADNIIQMQAQWAEAMTTYRDALAEIDRLTGRFDAAPLAETNR